jgi:hypothetical protein
MRGILTATFLLATLLLGAPVAAAAPPTAPDPPDILTPTEPPHPEPCKARSIPCDFTLPTTTADTPADTSTDTSTTTTSPTGTRTREHHDTETGNASGPVKSTPVTPATTTRTEWWLVAVPVLALLALAAAGTVLVIQRSERR